jgi:hypothetical protein
MENTSEIDVNKVKQWLKEQEKEMINLTVNQTLTEPVKCWVKSGGYWIERWLISIVDDEYCAINNYNHSEEITLVKSVLGGFAWYKHCTLTDPTIPTKKFKPWLILEDVPVELYGKALCKYKTDAVRESVMFTPYRITNKYGELLENLVYLPLGQPLTGEWLEMGEWV